MTWHRYQRRKVQKGGRGEDKGKVYIVYQPLLLVQTAKSLKSLIRLVPIVASINK